MFGNMDSAIRYSHFISYPYNGSLSRNLQTNLVVLDLFKLKSNPDPPAAGAPKVAEQKGSLGHPLHYNW